MGNKLSKSAVLFLVLFLFIAPCEIFSQTPGTLSFSVTTTSSGGYTPNHYLAIWIQNGTGTFIKTKISYTNADDLDHMQTWVNKSAGNITDATSGGTLTSHGIITFLWNGTNVATTLVPDGSYFTWLEMAWAQNLTTGKTVEYFPFTKGATAYHSTPPNSTNFSSIVLDWTPLSTGVEGTLESKDFNIYPNPSTGLLNIDFKYSGKGCILQIINESGQVVYKEKISDFDMGVRTFDLTRLSAGVYYCTLHFPGKDVVFSIIMAK